MDCLQNVPINELAQMCKIVTDQNVKQMFLTHLADKLSSENFKSLDEGLAKDIREIYSQLYNKSILNLWGQVFLHIKTKEAAQQIQNHNNISETLVLSEEEEEENFTPLNQESDESDTPIISEEQDYCPVRKRVLNDQKAHSEPQPSTIGTGGTSKIIKQQDCCSVRKRVLNDQPAHSEPQPGTSGQSRLEVVEQSQRRKSTRNKLVNIIIISHKSIFNEKFKCKNNNTIFKFKNIPQDITKLPSYLNETFDEILTFLIKDTLPHHKIGMKISLSDFNDSIDIKFTTVSELKSDNITSLLESQSNSNFLLTDSLEIASVILQIPHGKGRSNIKRAPSKVFLKYKIKSVVDFEVDEPIYCLPIAILLGKCIVDKNINKIRSYKRSNGTLMDSVYKLNSLANVVPNDRFGTSLIALASYQRVLPEYNIIVFNDRSNFRDITHFVAIRNVRLFFNKRYQCESCLELYNIKNSHLCPEKCKSCEMSPLCNRSQSKIKCDECNRHFYGQTCYNNHRHSICNVLQFCQLCTKLIDMRKRDSIVHSCDEKRCSVCSKLVGSNHNCYVQKHKQKSPANFSIIFFNLESTQNVGNETNSHEPNLCAAHIICNKCLMKPQSDYCCSVCGNRQHIFENNAEGKCVEKFINFCELFREKSATIFCIAHNFRAYEGQFILRELVKRKKSIQPIMGGVKIYKITYDSYINFIDSANFLPMPLSKFPEIFGLENMAKSWYPHLFNTTENYNYVGDVPDKKYFGTNHMLEKEINHFNIWYEERSSSDVQYNNREELIKYCAQDVNLLRRGCVAFMTNFLNITNVNPLLESFTLSQAAMLAFRKKFMQKDTLGIIPANLYHEFKKNQSLIGLKWLIYQNEKCNGKILYEVRIPSTNYYVDGYCKNTNTVYEFLGCYWHGCETCFLSRTQRLNGGIKDTFDLRKDQTSLRLGLIESLGYKIVREWECKFRNFLIKNPEVAVSLENQPELLHKYLNPKDALYGERTETFQKYYKAKEGEKIRYYHFKSLFPYVNKICKNPIQHPKIYYKDDCKNLDISKMDGLIKCSILPPRNLLIPVIPSKINNKLVFPLCRTCAETENVTATCYHKESARKLIGTWALDEIKLGVNHGYKICDIFEVWEYKISQYNVVEDNVDEKKGIFTDYINCFLKLKQEASGWPTNITSETEKGVFLKEFFSREGINLNAAAIKNNPSQKCVSKLALNALCGKSVPKIGRNETTIIQNLSELYSLVSSAGIIIIDIIALDDVLWVNWKHSTEDFSEPTKYVSSAVEVFTTANVRIKLYNELSKISQNILYCDTDSIIFVENERKGCILRTGNFLGDLSDEISAYGKNAYITEFANTGPKSFGYIIFDPDKNEYFEMAKCKGITLNLKSKKLLNSSTLKSMVLDNDNEGFRVVHDDKRIKRKKLINTVSQNESRNFGSTYLNRVCLGDLKTVPYGFHTK